MSSVLGALLGAGGPEKVEVMLNIVSQLDVRFLGWADAHLGHYLCVELGFCSNTHSPMKVVCRHPISQVDLERLVPGLSWMGVRGAQVSQGSSPSTSCSQSIK